MTNPEKVEEKIPHCYDYVMRRFHLVRDALRREAFREALNHTADAIAKVQNELDWCYRTDIMLPFIRQYLIQLGDAIGTVEKVIPSLRKELIETIIRELEEIPREQDQLTAGCSRWQKPDKYLDLLEKEHRARTYGRSLYDKDHAEDWRKH